MADVSAPMKFWLLLGIATGAVILLAWTDARAAECAFTVGAIIFQLR